jgi:hypothetical protein
MQEQHMSHDHAGAAAAGLLTILEEVNELKITCPAIQ